MSNALAVASVSFVLVDLLNNGLIDHDISASIGNDVMVTALSPFQVDTAQQSTNARSQLNLFLYNITQNQGWRNVGYPSRNSNGERIDNPPLAINLHYLLTAYGVEQFHAEILLGYAMQLFHETPVLPRNAIRRSLATPTLVAPGEGLAPYMSNLFTSELADQAEMIKIWPETLSTEEISRLWTAFQARYRPTAAYQVSVVLIESRATTKTALPVLSRNILATPFANPTIDEVLSQKDSSSLVTADPPILPGYTLVLSGSQLAGQNTSVVISGVSVVPAPTQLTDTAITVPLPTSGLLPGSQTVQIVQTITYGSSNVQTPGVESNVLSFVLSPVIQALTLTNLQGTGSNPRSGELQFTVNPAVGPDQVVKLILNQYVTASPPADSPLAYTFELPPRISLQSPPLTPPPPTSNITANFQGVVAGTYTVRIQVDDAASPLGLDASGYFATPQVTIA